MVDVAWPNGSSPFIGTISWIDVVTTDRQRRFRSRHQWDTILKLSWIRDKQDDGSKGVYPHSRPPYFMGRYLVIIVIVL